MCVLNAGEIVEAIPGTVCVCVRVRVHALNAGVCVRVHALNAGETVGAIIATVQQSWGKQCVQVPRKAPFKVSPCLSFHRGRIS